MPEDSIWEGAPLELYLSDEDFEAEYCRERTEEEKKAHEMFADAAMLADPSTWLESSKEEE